MHPAGRLWLARLDAFGDDLRDDWLGEDEAARLRTMTAPERRRSFLAGHWLARRAAGEWLQVDAARIGLERHPDGRPLLQVDGDASALSLSLSHSGDWLAVALADVAVGVDIELPRRSRDYVALARFAFSPEEVARLHGLDAAGRSAEFHRVWTLKEARGKRSGEGLLPGQSRRVTALRSDAETADAIGWDFCDGALALAIAPGARIDVVGGEGLGSRMWWRYREEA